MPDTILYDSAMRLFGDLVTPGVLAAAEPGDWPEGLWRAVEEAGYPGVLAEGAAGMAEAATILRAAGHHAAPIPLAETILARWLCAACGVEAPAGALTADGPLEYLEQPCATVPELAELRRRVGVPIAADASIRKADDPFHVVRAGAADIAVLKVAPLGGIAALLYVAAFIEVPVVVSSALDSAVGIAAGLTAAAALPNLRHACGLGTGGLFVEDVTEPIAPIDGYLPVKPATPDPARLAALAAPAERRQWWIDRVRACHQLMS